MGGHVLLAMALVKTFKAAVVQAAVWIDGRTTWASEPSWTVAKSLAGFWHSRPGRRASRAVTTSDWDRRRRGHGRGSAHDGTDRDGSGRELTAKRRFLRSLRVSAWHGGATGSA